MTRQRLLTVLLAAAVALLWWQWPRVSVLAAQVPGLSFLAKEADHAASGQGGARRVAVPVVTNKVERKTMPVLLDAVGTAQAIASIQIRARLDSQIVAVHVKEGAPVKAGDRLFSLDARALKAQIAQIDAQIVKDEAQLEQARRDLARADDLLERRINSPVQRDTAATNVKVQEAQLTADRAQRDNLVTSLSYTEITAPVSGRIGTITAKEGTVVRTADTATIATLNQFDPIFVAFSLPQSALAPLRQAMAAGPVTVEVRGTPTSLQGTVAFVENAVDLATGTIMVKASIPNSAELLWPGAFVSVRVLLGEQNDALVISTAAVLIGQDGPYVFVVKDDKAELKRVKIARTQGALSVVADESLQAGEDIVIDGQLRLVNGAPVTVSPDRSNQAGSTPTNGS